MPLYLARQAATEFPPNGRFASMQDGTLLRGLSKGRNAARGESMLEPAAGPAKLRTESSAGKEVGKTIVAKPAAPPWAGIASPRVLVFHFLV